MFEDRICCRNRWATCGGPAPVKSRTPVSSSAETRERMSSGGPRRQSRGIVTARDANLFLRVQGGDEGPVGGRCPEPGKAWALVGSRPKRFWQRG